MWCLDQTVLMMPEESASLGPTLSSVKSEDLTSFITSLSFQKPMESPDSSGAINHFPQNDRSGSQEINS